MAARPTGSGALTGEPVTMASRKVSGVGGFEVLRGAEDGGLALARGVGVAPAGEVEEAVRALEED